MIKETWYLLYNGQSRDGMGTPSYIGRTLDKGAAKAHFEECEADPCSIGKAVVVTEEELVDAGPWTDWDRYP